MSKNKIPPLFKHQKHSVDVGLVSPRLLDLSDPGTGKTRVQIEIAASRIAEQGGKVLVVCPKSLLESAWADDFAKFAPHLRTSIARANNRDKAFAADADIYITNTDAVKWLAKQKPSFFADFHTLVIDEASAFKHKNSQRSKALAKIRKHFEYRAALTGTPNSNSITDVWHIAFVIDDGQRLGTSFFHFRSSVCMPQQVGPSPEMVKWLDKPGAEQAVSALLSDITVRHKFEECLDIPKNFLTSKTYTMSAKQQRAYRDMHLASVAMIGKDVVSAVNAASVTTKLLQIASGAVYQSDPIIDDDLNVIGDQGDYINVDTSRYELIADLVIEREQCVVFFNWTHQRDNLIEQFEKNGITYRVIDGSIKDRDRADAVKGFQQGLFDVILAHPSSAAHGLTLTKGTTTIWASPTYNLEHFVQGNRRIYRAGQTRRTETIVVLAKNTIEETVFEKLADKNARQESFLSLLKTDFKKGK